MFNAILLIPVMSILAYLPYLCASDIQNRAVPHKSWLPLLAVNLPVLAYMMLIPDGYPWYSLAISLVMIGTFYVITRMGIIHGADFVYLAVISLFWVVNPFPWPHGLMQIMFYIYLIVVMMLTPMFVLIYNYLQGHRWNVYRMMSEFPRGIPMIVPISVAFVLSVGWG